MYQTGSIQAGNLGLWGRGYWVFEILKECVILKKNHILSIYMGNSLATYLMDFVNIAFLYIDIYVIMPNPTERLELGFNKA